ncbi:uncharacterized protein LOC119893722 [Micropterus salmoides]|uniref:uncharacterized protein LOC119893722 n=1 Tax=Micropterus salmoides TaxID=27706 RepID=UPI0018EAA60C|nr:uncharacterized protein LOC119893722 [Micropterus salmoides]
MAAVNTVPTSCKLIQVASSSPAALPNDLISFFTRFETDNIQLKEVLSKFKPGDSSLTINIKDLVGALKKTKVNTATGPDNISGRTMKYCAEQLCGVFQLFQRSLDDGTVPQLWKDSKVLDKYGENTWLGNRRRSTESVPGEWPVSYHGTSKEGAEGIIEGFYKPGSGDVYGRGIYSTPNITEARKYAKKFTSKNDGKRYKVVLQNRINPAYRKKHRKNRDYWLVPISKGKSVTEVQKMVERAIRPYGLLVKEV